MVDRPVVEPDRRQKLEDIAMSGIKRGIDFDPETADADTIYDDCFCAAFDALRAKGINEFQAREIADDVARRFAQP